MALYIMKTFDRNGRLVGRSEFRAARDDEATAIMRSLMENRSWELWCGSRRVADSSIASVPAPVEPRSFQPKRASVARRTS
jgi:hypothetical protein